MGALHHGRQPRSASYGGKRRRPWERGCRAIGVHEISHSSRFRIYWKEGEGSGFLVGRFGVSRDPLIRTVVWARRCDFASRLSN